MANEKQTWPCQFHGEHVAWAPKWNQDSLRVRCEELIVYDPKALTVVHGWGQ